MTTFITGATSSIGRVMVGKLTGQPVPAFFALTYGWTWLFWVPRAILSHIPGSSPAISFVLHTAGVYGPFLAGLVVVAVNDSSAGVRAYLRPWLNWGPARVKGIRSGLSGWSLLAVLARPGTMLAAALVRALLGMGGLVVGPFAPLDLLLSAGRELAGPGVGEETGWAGYAGPRIAQRYGLLALRTKNTDTVTPTLSVA